MESNDSHEELVKEIEVRIKNHYEEIAEDRQEAAEIRAKAIAAGTWGKPKETEAVETVAVPVAETPATVSSLPVDNIICSAVGFVVGAVAVTIYFRMKMNQLKRDCETRVNEARTALDRMLKIASGD